jgi:hypothetical protein
MRAPLLLALALVALPAGLVAQQAPVRRPPPEERTVVRPPPEQRNATVAPARAATSAVAGTFVATRIDREPLPLKDQVVDDDGTLYLIEFDRLVLALRGDNTFRASVRYRRTLFSSDLRSRGRPTPLQNMTVTGTFEVTPENEIRFTPDPTQENRGLRMLAGTVRGRRELEVPFQYRNGTQQRNRVLVMTRNDNIL